MKTLQGQRFGGLILLVLLAGALLLGGCVDTRYTIRQVDQHPAGRINTVETSGERVISLGPLWERREYLGINYWNCSQDAEKLTCSRICDDNWGRICSPGLRGAFGAITKPDAGVVLARFVSATDGEGKRVYVREEDAASSAVEAPPVEEEIQVEENIQEEVAEELIPEEALEEVEE